MTEEPKKLREGELAKENERLQCRNKIQSEPLVSAIIIFLNAENYIEEAIESVFAQTYQNWELLLCDDGSADGSTEIAQRCARNFSDKVRYLEHEGHQNRGMSATRNLGLRHSKGEYIAWLDADDVWLPRKLQRQVEIISDHPDAAMVYGPLQLWFSWTGNPDDYRHDFMQDIGVSHNTLLQPPQLLLRFLRNDMYIPSGVLVRRTALEEVGGCEESIRGDFEDVIVNAKICLSWPVYASDESWCRYRQHADSYCAKTTQPGAQRSMRLIYLNRLAEYLQEQGHDSGEVWHVVQDQIRLHRNTIGKTILESVQRGVEVAKLCYWRSARLARQLTGRLLPQSIRGWLGVQLKGREYCPPVGWVHFGGMRRVTPINRLFGLGRGTPCDRYYIEKFLTAHASDIRGRILEIGGRDYTLKFGGNHITRSDVLHVQPGNPQATLVGDLCIGKGIPESAFDCMILTQVFLVIYDFKAAIANAVRALKPGGVMLVTFPGISQITRYDADRWGDYWRFTSLSIKRMFEEHFDPKNLEINVYGNVLTAVSFLHGIAAEELHPGELDYRDPDYEIIITVRAVNANENMEHKF